VRNPDSTSTHKKVVVLLLNHVPVKGYLNPARLGQSENIDLLTSGGEHLSISLKDTKAIYFVREFADPFEPERKAFLSRPKLNGLWVRLQFLDEDVLEGIVSNNLVELLDSGVRLTPPDLNGNTLHMFIPRSALVEMKVVGVVGGARRSARAPRAASGVQSKLFGE
jgi:hypothetical protein